MILNKIRDHGMFRVGITLGLFLKPILKGCSHMPHQIEAQNLFYEMKIVW